MPNATDTLVTAVVVAHDGTRWLPETLGALAAQTRPPDLVLAADTGSTDGTLDLLRSAVGEGRLVACASGTGLGDAVRAALVLDKGGLSDRAGARSWVWVLHDDCVPAADALEQLLAEAARDPSIGIAGPKLRSLTDRRLLLEVGVTMARSGRRETLLERREYDQGQHDGVHDVLGVNTAGMLVRRDVWDSLGGLDPALPLLRDDVDLGWRATLAGHRVVCVTDAVAFHGEAATRGRRAVAVGGRLHRLDRRHATYVLLANLPLTLVPVALVTLSTGALLRAVGHLAGKRPGRAADEVAALVAVLGRPDRLVRARLARRRTRRVPARTALRRLAPRGAGWRSLVESLAAVVGTGSATDLAGRHRSPDRRSTVAPASGPTAEAGEDLPSWGSGLVRRLVLRPSVGLLAGLVLVTLLAERGLLGDGRLMGGALLPAPHSGPELWGRYVASWHPVGVGGDSIAPPYLAVLAALSSVLGGAERAVSLLLLGAVPLAGLSAYTVARRVVTSLPLQLWAAVTYALLPPVLGAVAAGRLGTSVVAILLPLAGLAAAKGLGLDGPDRRAGDNRALWVAVLLLAVMTAFVPLTLAVTAVLGGLALLTVRGRNLVRVALLTLVPPLLLLPWLPAVLEDLPLLLRESGLPGPGLSDRRLEPVEVLFLHPGGPGLPPLLLTLGLVLGALAALLRPDRRRPVLLGWVVVLVGLAAGVALSRLDVIAPTVQTPVPAWPGPATLLAGAGLVLAATVGAQDARDRVAHSSFGWRQPAAVVLAGLAVLGPVVLAGWWVVDGAGGPLDRRDHVLLPAFVAAEGEQPDRPRTLVLRARGDGALGYTLLRSDGVRLGDAELSPPARRGDRLAAVVADLASGRGGDATARLVPYGVRFVLLTRPVDRGIARAVDAVPGLVRVSGPSGSVLWRTGYPTGRLRVLPGAARVSEADGSPPPSQVLAAGQVDADVQVGAGPDGRLLVLADPVDDGWRASLDGRPLQARSYDGWAQAFTLPAEGGRLGVRHDGGMRPVLLWLQLAVVVVVVVLALPQARTPLDPSLDDPAVAA